MPLLTLRIEHAAGDGGAGEVRILLRDSERVLAEDRKSFATASSATELERLRSYWEEYLDEPAAESRTVEKQAERRLTLAGEALFRQLFDVGEARRLWNQIGERLNDVRVEIAEADEDAFATPWELLREPSSGRWIAREAGEFARSPRHRFPEAAARPGQGETLRCLAVLASPRVGGLEMESVFRRAELDILGGPRMEWHVLRPATVNTLARTIAQAHTDGAPFHVIHFEGAAFWCDIKDRRRLPTAIRNAGRPRAEEPIEGPRGYLLFDQAGGEDRLRLVDAQEIAEVMAEANTPLLTMTSCCRAQSSEAEGSEALIARAFHDFADRIVNQGAVSVVQFPYRLSADGAGLFYSAFYQRLAHGSTVSEAVKEGRRRLIDDPHRAPLGQKRTHLDWGALQSYEPLAVRLVAPKMRIDLGRMDGSTSSKRESPGLAAVRFPGEPPTGRVIRDKSVFDLEHELAAGVCLLLEGPAGVGKTQLAADLAQWLRRSGALDGPALYTDLADHRGFATVLEQLAGVFAAALSGNGIEWEPMDEHQQLEAALLVLSQIPVFWVWDSFETVDGDTDDDHEGWPEEERERLVQFLDLLPDTQGRLLLLSRSDERWLGASVKRRNAPNWTDRSLLRLVAGVVRAHRGDLPLDRCKPILEHARGNPLTARMFTRVALEKGLESPLMIRDLAKEIRDKASIRPPLKGLDAHLSATVIYVLHQSLSDPELEIAALGHLFPRVMDTQLLERMANPHRSWGLRELNTRGAFKRALAGMSDSPIERIIAMGWLRRMTPRQCRIEPIGRVAFEAALDLLRPASRRPALSGRLTLFSMQPGEAQDNALTGERGPGSNPLVGLEGKTSGDSRTPIPVPPQPGAGAEAGDPEAAAQAESEAVRRASAAFVEALAELGAEAARAHLDGAAEVVARMNLDEAGFERAIDLAMERAWWRALTGLVAGLGAVYENGGRLSSWGDMLRRVTPVSMHLGSNGPIEGREKLWRTVAEQRVRLACRRRSHTEALEMQKAVAKWDRVQARVLNDKPIESLTSRERATVMTLARSLSRLAEIACLESQPAHEAENHAVLLCEQLGEHRLAADWAYEMGCRYTEVRAVRDLSRAERWLKRASDLLPDNDSARSRFLASLGQVAWERFQSARRSDKPEAELIRHLTDARRYYEQAIEHADPKDYGTLAGHHLQYAHVSYSLGDVERAVPHYRESIRHDLAQGNKYGAARTRFNLAIALRDTGRLGEARKYAVSAFSELRSVRGPVMEGLLDRSRRLVMNIEQKLQSKRDKHNRRFATHTY